MIYLKDGSTTFCYAGHQTDGSMGDNSTDGNGTSSAATLNVQCGAL